VLPANALEDPCSGSVADQGSLRKPGSPRHHSDGYSVRGVRIIHEE